MATPPNPMMAQAMQQMQNPMGQSIPQQQGGGIDPNHPIGRIIQMLAQAAQSFGMTAMGPQERNQRLSLDQQKAEAMGNLAARQQQLGMEQQRTGAEVGLSGAQQAEAQARTAAIPQTTAADVAAKGAQTKLYGVQAEQEPLRTGIEQKRATIEQQRADQEYAAKKQELEQNAQKLQAEYGPGGLRSREVGTEERRVGVDAQLADIADKRWALEKQKDMAEIQRAGLTTDIKAIEDKRTNAKTAIAAIYGKSPWYEFRSTTLDTAQKKLKEIDDYYDAQLAQAQKGAGTGAGATNPSIGGAMSEMNRATGQAQGGGGVQHFNYDAKGNRLP